MARKKGNPGCPCCDCGASLTLPGNYDTVDEGTIEANVYYENSFRRIVDAEVIGINNQDKYIAHYATLAARQGNEPVFGMSSADGRWKIYLQWSTDDDYLGLTRLDTYTAALYKVEDGGSPVAIGGPYVLTARMSDNSLRVVCVYDENTNEISFSWYPISNTNSGAMPWNPATAYPSICVAERLKDADDAYVQMRCPFVGVFAGSTILGGWIARQCVCSGAITVGGGGVIIQNTAPSGQKFSKWPAGMRATFAGVTSPWDEYDYYYDEPQNELNGDHDFGSEVTYVLGSFESPTSVCVHILKREVVIYRPIFEPVVVFTSILGLDLSLVSSYDSVADETTITMSGYINTPTGYLSGLYFSERYISQAVIFSKIFSGDKDVRYLDDDLDLESFGAGPWDFGNATLHLTTPHP